MNFPFLKWASLSSELSRLFKPRRKTPENEEARDVDYDQRSLDELGEDFAKKRKSADDPSLTPLQRRMLSGGA
jgi:hypothetical protein